MKLCSALFLFFLFAVAASAQGKVSGCRPASQNDLPLGGNNLVMQIAGKVKRIKGKTVFDVDGKYFKDVVVEVFRVSDKEKREIEDNAHKIPDSKQRLIACVTGERGEFGFENLPKGVYVLRVGTRTREIDHFNYVFVIVEIDPKYGKSEDIEVGLSVAT